MKSKTLIILLASILISFNISGQISEKMKSLEHLIGKYSVTTYDFESGEWIDGDTTSSVVEKVHDGAFLREQVKYETKKMEITMLIFIGFDRRINKYKLCAMDKEFQSMDIYHGEISDKMLVFSNMESDKPLVFDDGSKIHFRLSYNFNETGFTHLVEGTKNNGTSWFPFSKSIYRKL